MSEPGLRQIDVWINRASDVYRVVVGSNLLSRLPEMLGEEDAVDRVAIVCDAAIAESYGKAIEETFRSAGIKTSRATITADEQHKTIETVSALHAEFLNAGLDRKSLVIAVGGGVTGDTAGFAAATFMRGVRFVNVPTTLLAMVDASVGGKTGVNIPLPGSAGTLGKNLVGAFHQPRLVLIDVGTLDTLSSRQLRSGMAECVKHALLADETLLTWIEENGAKWSTLDADAHATFIARNVQIKAEVVEQDEREAGRRMTLNLGHTFAHAIETQPALNLLHGEAVALGLIAAAAAGEALGRTDSGLKDRLRTTLAGLDLPTTIANLPPLDDLTAIMRHDKKSDGGRIRLVVPIRPGVVEVVPGVDVEVVHAGWRSVSEPGS